MRTWSAEELFVKAYTAGAVAVQGVLDAFTRRPGYDYDVPLPGCPNPSDCREYSCAGDCSEATEVPNPTEPGLDDAELIGVRGLLQERYCTDADCQGRLSHSPGRATPLCGCGHWLHFGNVCPACGCNNVTLASQSVPVSPAGASAEGDNSPPSPSARPPWSDLADAMVEHRPAAKADDGDCYDLPLLLHNARNGIASWLEGDLCRDVTYWESVLDRLIEAAIQLKTEK